MALQSAPAGDADDISRFTDHAVDRGDPLAAGELIAHVLRRAHDKARTLNSHDEARAILHIAWWLADELAATNPGFDRTCFVKASTGL